MERSIFDAYLSMFNTKDYDGLLQFWDDECIVEFAGYKFNSKQEFRNFYKFLHAYLNETILVDAYLSDDKNLMIEARVRIEGIKAITPEEHKASGFENMMLPSLGQIIEIPQFIHYKLKNGKFKSVICAISEQPRIIK